VGLFTVKSMYDDIVNDNEFFRENIFRNLKYLSGLRFSRVPWPTGYISKDNLVNLNLIAVRNVVFVVTTR
jgi:hypothetical protein